MITYGNGEVLFDGNAKGFELRYKGSVSIESNADSLLISVGKNKIAGLMVDGTDLPVQLFTYEGEFRLLSCKTTEGSTLERQPITLQGVDYWNLDNGKWEDDTSVWGSGTGTYLTGNKPRKSVVINDKFAEEKAQPVDKKKLKKVINAVKSASKGSY
jgi:hypothetical protein